MRLRKICVIINLKYSNPHFTLCCKEAVSVCDQVAISTPSEVYEELLEWRFKFKESFSQKINESSGNGRGRHELV
jgi:hypothetical protein